MSIKILEYYLNTEIQKWLTEKTKIYEEESIILPNSNNCHGDTDLLRPTYEYYSFESLLNENMKRIEDHMSYLGERGRLNEELKESIGVLKSNIYKTREKMAGLKQEVEHYQAVINKEKEENKACDQDLVYLNELKERLKVFISRSQFYLFRTITLNNYMGALIDIEREDTSEINSLQKNYCDRHLDLDENAVSIKTVNSMIGEFSSETDNFIKNCLEAKFEAVITGCFNLDLLLSGNDLLINTQNLFEPASKKMTLSQYLVYRFGDGKEGDFYYFNKQSRNSKLTKAERDRAVKIIDLCRVMERLLIWHVKLLFHLESQRDNLRSDKFINLKSKLKSFFTNEIQKFIIHYYNWINLARKRNFNDIDGRLAEVLFEAGLANEVDTVGLKGMLIIPGPIQYEGMGVDLLIGFMAEAEREKPIGEMLFDALFPIQLSIECNSEILVLDKAQTPPTVSEKRLTNWKRGVPFIWIESRQAINRQLYSSEFSFLKYVQSRLTFQVEHIKLFIKKVERYRAKLEFDVVTQAEMIELDYIKKNQSRIGYSREEVLAINFIEQKVKGYDEWKVNCSTENEFKQLKNITDLELDNMKNLYQDDLPKMLKLLGNQLDNRV